MVYRLDRFVESIRFCLIFLLIFIRIELYFAGLLFGVRYICEYKVGT